MLDKTARALRPGLFWDYGLKVVLQGELHLSRARAYRSCLALDIAEAGRGDIADRIAEVCAIEDVIGISPEVNLLLMPDGEVLGDRGAVALEARRPFRGRTSGTEGSRRRLTIGADAVIDTCASTRHSRRIGSEPVAVGAIDNLQLPVVICALRVAVHVRVVGCAEVDGEAGGS